MPFGPLPPDQFDDLSCGSFGFLVLPNTYDRPPGVAKYRIRITVPFDVPPDLLFPEIRVRLRLDEVLRAAVPIAPVDENSDFDRPEDEVRRPPQAG